MAILCWCILSSQEINFILLSINSVIKAGSAFLIFLNHDHLGCNKFHLQLCGNFETTLRFFRDINLQSVSFATLWQRSKLRSVKILTWNQCDATLWQRCDNLCSIAISKCNQIQLQLCGNVETTLRFCETLTCNQCHLQRCDNVQHCVLSRY